MYSLLYEHLIRQVLDCGRTQENGADPDIYRQMEKCFQAIDNPYAKGVRKYKELEFRLEFEIVKIHIRNALRQSLVKINGVGAEHINAFILELNMVFYDKKRLDEIIVEANNILRLSGVFDG